MSLEHRRTQDRNHTAVIIALLSLLIATYSLLQPKTEVLERGPETSLVKILQSKILHVGYAGFPPYTIVKVNEADPQKRMQGIAVDIINEIASRQTPPWRVEWHKISFESLAADMSSGKIDVIAEPIYHTVSRATQFAYTRPFSYFGAAVAIVRKDEQRFKDISDLNHPEVKLVLAEGWTSTDYAKRYLTRATMRVIPIADDPFVQFNDVIMGRADAALQDVPTVLQFVKAHKNEVKALWLHKPPLTVAGGFIVQRHDFELKHFFDVSLEALELDGSLGNIDTRWQGLGMFRQTSFVPGAGLLESSPYLAH